MNYETPYIIIIVSLYATLVTIIIAFIVAVGQITNEVNEIKTYLENQQHMQMQNPDSRPLNASGVYIPGCGYFVDIRGDNFKAINNTEYHEGCHAMIHENKKHFCED